jgi:hypothetical protein
MIYFNWILKIKNGSKGIFSNFHGIKIQINPNWNQSFAKAVSGKNLL